jgi:putative molybdopterin biosynthesis protein
MGEDVVATELVLPENHALSAVDLGALDRGRPHGAAPPTKGRHPAHRAGLGRTCQPLKPGDIVDFNSIVLASQVREWGGEPTRLPIA